MKLRGLLGKLRLGPAQDQGRRSVDETVDAKAGLATHGHAGAAPTNWVPSQQDERPRH